MSDFIQDEAQFDGCFGQFSFVNENRWATLRNELRMSFAKTLQSFSVASFIISILSIVRTCDANVANHRRHKAERRRSGALCRPSAFALLGDYNSSSPSNLFSEPGRFSHPNSRSPTPLFLLSIVLDFVNFPFSIFICNSCSKIEPYPIWT